MKVLVAALVFLTAAVSHAQAEDLFEKQAEQQQAQQNQEFQSRMAAEHARLLAGMRAQTRKMAPIDEASAKCSSGWENSDYENAVDKICDSEGCVTVYDRPSEGYDGVLFTCHFNLTNGSQCFLQGYSSPHEGYSGRCVNTALKDHPLDINTSVNVGGKTRPKAKSKKRK